MAQKHKDDRFAFSESGSFQVSRDGERLGLIAAILGLFLLLAANVVFFVLQILQIISEIGWFYEIKAIFAVNLSWIPVLLALSAAEIFLFHIVRIMIFRGVTYYYFADETFFSFRCPKRRVNLSVKYEDVVAVTYLKRRALWYPRGYTAAITLRDEKTLVFRCITYERIATRGRVLKKPAAFQLLEKRIEAMRQERKKELAETIEWNEEEF